MKSIKLPLIHKKQSLFVGAVVIGIASALFYVLLLANQSGQQQTAEAFVKQLQSQVDATDGSPRDGRDPASQGQTSLASAASQPTGTGQRTTQQATATDSNHHHTGGDTNLVASGSAVGANGCFVDYGKPGEQCLPAHAAPDGNLTCANVIKYFPNGITTVYGTDRFHLDTNHDGTACGSGDF